MMKIIYEEILGVYIAT